VVAAPEQALPALASSVTVTRDPIAGRGPLQGIAAGLRALRPSIELAYATATDVPFLNPSWIGCLRDLIGDDDLALPWVGGYHHPLAALYRPSAVLPAIQTLLNEDRLRPVFLIERVRTRIVAEDELRGVDPTFQTLRNLNSPEDYSQAVRDAGLET
jgi:molybdopterin-guanine dinucleotide biosynthesis protein A